MLSGNGFDETGVATVAIVAQLSLTGGHIDYRRENVTGETRPTR